MTNRKGTVLERVIADWLAVALNDDRIDRKPRNGSRDTGDIGGVRVGGRRLVIEVKNVRQLALAAWVDEARLEAVNDGAVAGIVVHKRRGKADAAEQYVTLTLGDFVAILAAAEGQP